MKYFGNRYERVTGQPMDGVRQRPFGIPPELTERTSVNLSGCLSVCESDDCSAEQS